MSAPATSPLTYARAPRSCRSVPALPPHVRFVRDGAALAAKQRPKITDEVTAAAQLQDLADEEVEVFVVLALDGRGRVIHRADVTRGLVDSSLVHPREAFRAAIVAGASSIIIAHNHPSGDTTPSAEDRAVTKQLVAAGQLLDIPVADHLIIGASGYTSFVRAGLM